MSRHATISVTNKYTGETKELAVEAWFGDSRYGFNHFATAYCKAEGFDEPLAVKVKIHYINRTWEAYPFDCVIAKAVRAYQEAWEKSIPRYKRPRIPTRRQRLIAAANDPAQMTLGL